MMRIINEHAIYNSKSIVEKYPLLSAIDKLVRCDEKDNVTTAHLCEKLAYERLELEHQLFVNDLNLHKQVTSRL